MCADELDDIGEPRSLPERIILTCVAIFYLVDLCMGSRTCSRLGEARERWRCPAHRGGWRDQFAGHLVSV